MEKHIISVENNVTLFIPKGLLEQILFFSALQLGFHEIPTIPLTSKIPLCTCNLKMEESQQNQKT